MTSEEQIATLGRVAAKVASDLRGPLTEISTSVYYLGEVLPPGRDDRADEAIRLIQESVRRATRMVDDLLYFSRPPEPTKHAVNVFSVATDVIASLPPHQYVKVRVEVPRELVVEGDGDMLRRALSGLVENAYDAMPKGGTLGISAAKGDGVTVFVSDTGVGIPMKDFSRIFDPFFTTKAGGLGLGLPIARRIAEAHGGRLTLFSAPGKGATFALRLPAGPTTNASPSK
jgi:two-component system sensor histidine kinase HydH